MSRQTWTAAHAARDIPAMTTLAVLGSGHWPAERDHGSPTPPPGFIGSSFIGLVAELARRCLAGHHTEKPLPPAETPRTAVMLVSPRGDVATAAAVARAVDTGGRVSPLLFFQSVPNSVAGWVAAHWGLDGPVVCTSPAADPVADAVRTAELLLDDGEADRVLLLLVDQAGPEHESDQGAGVLLARRPAVLTNAPTTSSREPRHGR
ncbi:beta-ketoacyl synthase chain length factor [Micromonospora sp. NPDC049101]|uniref:beta-ketoacyl synthase chain length factor n=1 Tax=Micromonospora sp. NPDC049101 TaxID=3155032 RepID=UPI0033D6FF4B